MYFHQNITKLSLDFDLEFSNSDTTSGRLYLPNIETEKQRASNHHI